MNQQLKGLFMELQWYLGRVYPPFVTERRPAPLPSQAVPVFIFHSVAAPVFREQLQFLSDNRYRTITADELLDALLGRRPALERSVMLTFDDGEQSVHRVAYPLLREFGFRAVAFIVPSRMCEEEQPEIGGKGWLTWRQVDELHRSGHVDIQSHTLNHERMFVGDAVEEFVRPGLFVDGLGLDAPTVLAAGVSRPLTEDGAPVYPMASRMSDRLKYIDDEPGRDACVRWVREHGGPDFFGEPGWKRQLRRCLRENRRSAGRYESAAEQRRAMLENLTASKASLERRCGKPVLHLAYPWGVGCGLSVELSRQAGYATNFWGPLKGVRLNGPGGNPHAVSRLKDDYIFRLPGRGRKSLADIFLRKFRRRRQSSDIY